jgi:hypothetical protein
MIKIIIPTLQEIIQTRGVKHLGLIVRVQCSDDVPGLDDRYAHSAYQESRGNVLGLSRAKLANRHERLLENPELDVLFCPNYILTEGPAGKEKYNDVWAIEEMNDGLLIFGYDELTSAFGRMQNYLKERPSAIRNNLLVEIVPSETDQTDFDKAMRYAAKIGITEPHSRLVRLVSSGKKSYQLNP